LSRKKNVKIFKEWFTNLNALAGELKSKRTCPTRALKIPLVFWAQYHYTKFQNRKTSRFY